MVKTEATSKRKAEDEEAKETLVKVAGLTTMTSGVKQLKC